MNDKDTFDKNLARWAAFYPKAVEIVRTLPRKKAQYPHHAEKEHNEADQWFKSLDLKNVDVLWAYGVGFGHIYDAAKEWLRQDEHHFLVLADDDFDVLNLLLQTDRATEILHDKQVWLVPLDNEGTMVGSLSEMFVLRPFLVAPSALYSQQRAEKSERLKTLVAFYMNLRGGTTQEYTDSGRSFFSNFFPNIKELPKSYLGTGLWDKFKGVPAIICGAGPSLAKNLHVLETLRDRALIFAGGTAMNALNATGFLPHLGVGIDPNPAQFTRLIMNQAYEIPFLYRNRFLNEALRIIHGDHLYVTGSGGYETAAWFEEKLGIQGQDISEGCNVVNMSVSIAHAMGCNPIILVGVDLAYTDGKSYAPGIINHPLHERKEYFRTKSQNEELLNKPDINGQPTITLWKWISESLWFTGFARKNPGTVVINSTEGGIGFAEIENIPLAEAAKRFLRRQYDFQGWITAQIQQSPLPPTVTRESTRAVLKEMLESLRRCYDYCHTVRIDFEESEHKLREELSIPENIVSDKGIEALAALEQEVGYIHLLNVFSEQFIALFTREYKRLAIDENLLTEREINLKRVSLNASRYKFLKETAKVSIHNIEKVIEEDAEEQKMLVLHKESRQQAAPYAFPKPHKEERYAFENGVLTLRDPELGLNIEEPFVPDEIVGMVRDNYPNGTLKSEQYVLEGALHGPSSYFGEQGQLLTRFWFVRGKRQGKGYSYYLNKALRSLEKYKDDLLEGEQLYLFPNGLLKSSLPYTQGQLNGDVRLYHDNGQLQRQLHFVHGKRKGFERIWNKTGLLILEAEFDEDKPVRTARKWYFNGNIAKEVAYDADGINWEIREWDEYGTPISREKQSSGDYFDQVAMQATKLTESLENFFQQISSLAPLVGDAVTPDKKKAVQDSLFNDMKEVALKLQHLDEINKKLLHETGLDPSNQDETIWKSPSSQREVEKEIEKMTLELTGGMNTVQNALVNTLGLLTKQLTKRKEDLQKQSEEEKPPHESN